MDAVLIAVGTELTCGQIQDTNSTWLSWQLDGLGVRTVMAISVPDSRAAIKVALEDGLELQPDLLMIMGGLGPTSDDITTEALADTLGLSLELDPEAERMVSGAIGLDNLDPQQRKQASLPQGAVPITPAGTAPGYIVRALSIPIVVLPGVPWEMKKMWEEVIHAPLVRKALELVEPRHRRSVCFYGAGEPRVAAAVDDVFDDVRDRLDLGVCSRYREVTIEVSFEADVADEVHSSLEAVKQELAQWYYSDGDSIEMVIGGLLTKRGNTLAVAESCTGGMLGEAITSVPGSSEYFLGGVMAYANEVKHSVLRVRQEALDQAGAVSEPVAQQLALGVRKLTGAEYGLGITGVAGPSGGTEEKPVGLVFICASSEVGDMVERFDFPGERGDVRAAAVKAALHMLHRKFMDEE